MSNNILKILNELPDLQPVIRCGICRHWVTGIAYESVGRCRHETHKGLITGKSYFCGDGEPKP